MKVGAGGKAGKKGWLKGVWGGNEGVGRSSLFVGMRSGCASGFLLNLEQAEEMMDWSICLMP